jgi:uncharacterized delta-60 repeat protein
LFDALRLMPDGTLDPTFGTGGEQPLSFGAKPQDSASAIALRPDGKIVLAGSVDGSLAVIRLNTYGSQDGTFGSGGMQF